jgi:hypothetical protein
VNKVLQNIQFRDCVHRGVVGASPEAVRAAVLGEHCAPPTSPVEAGKVFLGVARVLGEAAFRETWAAFQKQRGSGLPDPRLFADFLEPYSREIALPQLVDLARFDFAYFLAAQPSPMPSIGACCLPEAMIRSHPELMLRFQPGWRYLHLSWPVHLLLPEILSAQRLAKLSRRASLGIRVGPDGDGVALAELPPAAFVLEDSLRSGKRLADATAAARAIDATIDPFPIVARLVEAGAIIDAVLHPAEPVKPNPTSNP